MDGVSEEKYDQLCGLEPFQQIGEFGFAEIFGEKDNGLEAQRAFCLGNVVCEKNDRKITCIEKCPCGSIIVWQGRFFWREFMYDVFRLAPAPVLPVFY